MFPAAKTLVFFNHAGCNLEPGPTANTFYAQDSTVLKICANGTMFSKDVCVCIDIPNLEDNCKSLITLLHLESG